jgi:hypothetical protein
MAPGRKEDLMLLTRVHLEILAAVLVLLAGILAARSWIAEHDARLKAEVTVEANKKASDVADAKSKSLEAEIVDRDKSAAAREQTMLDAVKNLKTTPQILPYLQSNLAPAASQPIIVTVPAATKDNPVPDAILTLPQADLPALRDRLSKCDTDALGLSTCQADAVSNSARLALAGEKLSAMQNERDAYATELKGGTFWRRTKTALKFIGVGLAVGAAAICGSGHCR